LHDELQPGARINVRAPSGTFVFTGEEARSIVLIGGGVGITPLMSVVRWLADRRWPGDIHLLLAFRHPRDYLFRDELEELGARIPGLHLTVTMSSAASEPWSGSRGRIDESLLVAAVPDLRTHRIHLCGPAPMMDHVRGILRGLGVPRAQVRTEAFGTIKRDPTAKVASGGAIAGRVKFQRSQLVRPVAAGATILEAAEEAGIGIENACRSGTCGSCRVRLLAGRVHMPVDDALAEDEKTEGQILACQAEPEGDVEVEA
jgi:ferredoxin-NADP reductase